MASPEDVTGLAKRLGRRPIVLVVDDDDIHRELLAEALELAGYAVATAPNGAFALEYLQKNPKPDVVICDLDMPHVDGQQLCPCISRDYGIPIVLLSGSSELSRIAGELGISTFLNKPAPFDQILSALVSALK